MTIVIVSIIGACIISIVLIVALVFLSLKVMEVLKVKNNTAAEHRHEINNAFARDSNYSARASDSESARKDGFG